MVIVADDRAALLCFVWHSVTLGCLSQGSGPISMQALLRHISARLQGLGDCLSAAKDRLGHFLQEMAAKIRYETYAVICLPLHPLPPPCLEGLKKPIIPGHSLMAARF